MIAFECLGEQLAATIDDAKGTSGVLIVSGGNELRIGAHRGMAMLGRRLAAAGVPVFRFDRRGIGDSSGQNDGFESAGPDIAAAVTAFRAAAPHVMRIVGFGNCDAATALALHGACDNLVLANPWVIEERDELPPAAAIRARYADRLRDPKALWRLVTGGVDVRSLWNGLRKLSASGSAAPTSLARRMAIAFGGYPGRVTILLARSDNTAIAFRDAWHSATFAEVRDRVGVFECDTASHSFARPQDKDWLFERLIEATR